MKFEGISVDDILANSKPEAVEQEAQIDAEKTGLDFSSVGVDSLIADRDQQSFDATSAVTAKAPDLANRERMIAEKMETTRIDAEYNLEALEKQNESNEIGKVLSEAPTLTNHLANNPANAPILRNDLGTLRDIEKSLGKFGLEIDESGDIDLLAEAETGWQAAREDVVENATVGFASGKAIGDQGILWAKIRDQGLEITEELKKVSESYEQKINGMNDRDSFIADAAQIVGTMTSAFLNSANETAALSGGVVAAGMATGIGAPVASTVAGAMVVGGSMRAMYDIEGGLAYKEMIEKGADPGKAKLISQGVGLVNSLIEFGGVTLLGKAFGPVMRTLTTKHTAKTAAALSEASMLNLISESSKAMVKSVGAEVATEVMQELVNVAGEGLANEFANAQFDENTLESVYDRLSEIAIKTAKGMFVLGSLGMAPTIVVGSRKVYEARKAEEFFTALSDGMSKSEAAQVAPEVMAGVVQQMAEDAKTGVVYVDAAELQQVLTDNNVSLDQLEELVPGVKEVLEQKAINKEDIVMPTGQYAAKIAGTDLGKALTPHVRLSENALSVSDAAKLRKEQTAMLKSILEGKVSEEDIDQDILQMTKVSQAEIDKLEAEYDQIKDRMKGTKDEERKALQAEAKAMRERIQTVKANMRVGFVAEYEALKTKMFEQIKETGVYNDAEAKTNAKYGAWLVTNLARRAGLKPERVAELAPSIGVRMFDEGYKAIDTLAMKKRSHDFDEQIKKWRNGDMSELSFDLGEPSWVLQIFGVSKDLPLVAKAAQMFHVLHKKGEKTKINFKNYRGVHGMTDEELKGILVAIQQPIAVFQSASMPDSIVLATELKRRVIEQKVKDKKGNTYLTTVKVIDENSTPQEIAQSVERYVVVPIALRVSADGIEVMNDISSIYEKNEFPADWFSKYLLGYDAKKGPEFIAQGLGSTSSPTQTGPSSKVIVYQNETSVGDLYQVAPKNVPFEDSLVTLHNITENGLLKAADLGGLPAPSIAVSKASSPLQQFGEITLVGTKDLADPTKNPVFSVDAYTKRFPKLDWSKSLKKDEARNLRHEIEKAQEQVGDMAANNRVTYYLYNRPNRDMAIEKLTDSAAGIAMFFNHKGISFKPVRKKAKREWGVNDNTIAAYKAIEKKFGSVDVGDQNESRKIFAKAMFDWAKSQLDSGGSSFGYVNKILNGIVDAYESDPYLLNGSARKVDLEDFVESVRRYIEESKRLSGQSVIDEVATKELLEKKIARYQGEYEQYIQERVSEAFGNPGVVDGEKVVPLTLENVVRAMTRGEIRGAEGGFASNVSGAIRAKASKQYESMEDLQSDRERVVNRDESWESEKEVDSKIDEFISSVAKYWKYSTSSFGMEDLEGARNVLVKCAQNPTVANLKRALKNEGFEGVDDETIQKGIDALMSAKQVLTDYLEVKPQRAVALSEFAGAVVPNTISEEARSVLEKAGLQIQTYNPKLEGARTRSQQRLMKRLQKERGDILYQENEEMPRGSFASSSNAITLTPKADLSTFAHEMGHWYLETLFAIYGETTSASVRSDVEVMLKDFGLKSIGEWKALPFKEREVLHERFAFYVEQYLAEGKAPTKETRGFFKRFGAWIRGVYSRFGKGAKEELNNAYRQRFDIELPEMSEEVRRVLDRMLAAESAIKQAEQAEGIVPLFKQKPADMDDGLWEQLMQESDDAYAEAADAAFERMARDEKWYSNARSRKLKEIQQQADEVKNIVRDKVEKELDAKAESKAFNMVKLGGLKMDPELLKKEGFDSVTIDALKKGGLCKRGGMSPTAVRELVRAAKSYHTTKRMIAEFVTLSDREKLVDELVTKRCLRDYSELFNTKKRDAIISKALHNEARGRMVATELSYLANDKEGRSRIYREAARRAAEQMINGMQIGSVSVRKFIAAEARASRKAYEALQSSDRYAAVLAKRAQLVQHEAALMAIEIEQEVRRVKSLKDRIFKADKKLAKTHDIDIINVARYVMTNEGLGKGAPSSGDPSEALKYVEKLKTYDPDKYALFTNFIDKHGYKGNIDFARYTVSYAMEVIEDAQMLYRMAREAKTLTLDGKRIDREEVVNELVERYKMVDRGEFDGGKYRVITAKSKLAFALMNLKAKMVRVENWCHAMDGGQTGPFFNYIYKPIANAAAKFRNLNNKTQEALVNVLKPMIDEWSNVREIEAAEIGYTFATKAELIGAMLHTGNESNKAKLLLGGRGDGEQWARLVELQDGSNFVDTTQWDAFVARAMQDGIITKRDMDVIQKLWDLMESTKPVAQKAFKEMYGTYFEEVEATEVVTPWGNYRGGYVPAITDHYLVPASLTFEEAKRIAQQDFVSQMPVHQPGFSKSRVPSYTKSLALDVGLLCGHVQEVLKFAVMAPVAQEVAKVIYDKRFVEPIEKHDPTIVSQMLDPWLKRSYEQTVSDGKTDMFSAKLNQLRGIAGMNIMAGHIVNALQQWTGLSIAATKVKPRYMANALALIVSGKRSPAEVMELSPFMKARLNDRAFEFQSQIERIAKTSENVKQAKGLINKTVALDEKLDAARDWASRHGYFLQTAMQAPIDTIVWIGAYNQSIDVGMSEEDAIANADSIVRTTQSAFDPESVAGIETGGALYRCFLVFYNYFNMQLNLLGESWEGAKRTKKYGKFALDSMFIVAIPSILSAILTQMITGFDTGDDDEWDSYDAMRLLIAEPFKNVIAMAPFVGGGVTAGGAALANADVAWAKFIWGEDPYQGRMMNAPAFDALATGGSSLLQWVKASEGEDYNARSAVRGTLDLLSIATRLPLGALKKPLGYAAGVASGDIEPESVGEAIRGTLAGRDISK